MKKENFVKFLADKFSDNVSLLDKSKEIDTRQAVDRIGFL